MLVPLFLDIIVYNVDPTLPQIGGIVLCITGACIISIWGASSTKGKKKDSHFVKEHLNLEENLGQ
jgi:hypothetical protein